MATTSTVMPSSIGTNSTESDTIRSPQDDEHPEVKGDSPPTSRSHSPASSAGAPNGHDKGQTQHYETYNVKRQRTISPDGGRYSPRQYNYSPPKRDDHHRHVADRALHVLGDNDPRSTGQSETSTYYTPSNNGQPAYWGGGQSASNSAPSRTADAPMRDGSDEQQFTSPPPGTDGQSSEAGGTSNTHHGDAVTQANKRKRNFSNRTKTGCLTCRSRKKKCDEQRPECLNCQKGGFPCSGYSGSRGVWPKSSDPKRPILLQSKDGQQSSIEVAYKNDSEPTSAHPAHHTTAPPQHTSIDPHGEATHAQYPQRAESRGRSSYSGQPWPPQQGHPPYTNELPPLSELARTDSSAVDYSLAQPPPPREMSRPPPQSIPPPLPPAPNPQAGHWGPAPPAPSGYRPFNPPRLEHPAPPVRPPPAPYDYHKSGAKTFTVEEVQRSRMLRHTKFNYFDPTLKNERQRCAEALARYNGACMLRSGVTEEEAQRMLMKVFDPALDTTHHPIAACKEKGILGPGVKIEGPFKCTYGYNLRIMDNVFIGENTKIDDSARVEIGARCWIGPNVTILTMDVSKDMVDRKGTESLCHASPVIIHSEVVIGANAVIGPGVTLGRGSTVEPFAVVRTPLGENQTQQAAIGPRHP